MVDREVEPRHGLLRLGNSEVDRRHAPRGEFAVDRNRERLGAIAVLEQRRERDLALYRSRGDEHPNVLRRVVRARIEGRGRQIQIYGPLAVGKRNIARRARCGQVERHVARDLARELHQKTRHGLAPAVLALGNPYPQSVAAMVHRQAHASAARDLHELSAARIRRHDVEFRTVYAVLHCGQGICHPSPLDAIGDGIYGHALVLVGRHLHVTRESGRVLGRLGVVSEYLARDVAAARGVRGPQSHIVAVGPVDRAHVVAQRGATLVLLGRCPSVGVESDRYGLVVRGETALWRPLGDLDNGRAVNARRRVAPLLGAGREADEG